MARKIRKKHSDAFKLKVALAAIKGDKSVAEMCSEFGISSSQIYGWKDMLLERGVTIFKDKRCADKDKKDVDRLHRIIGKITAERDLLSSVLD